MNIKIILLIFFCLGMIQCSDTENGKEPDKIKMTQPQVQKTIDQTIQELSTHIGKDGVQGITRSLVDGEEVISVYYAKSRDVAQPAIPKELNGYKIVLKPTTTFK